MAVVVRPLSDDPFIDATRAMFAFMADGGDPDEVERIERAFGIEW